MGQRLLFLLFSLFLLTKSGRSQTWMALDGGLWGGSNGSLVRSIDYDTIHHLLFAGGVFTYADTIESHHLAVWDGQSWNRFYPGALLTDQIMALLVNNDTLITSQNDYTVILWQILSKDSVIGLLNMGHFDDDVNCFIRFNGTYVAGGDFSEFSGTTLNSIAIWDGYEWQPMSEGFWGSGYSVFDLAVYNGELYAAGYFEKDVATNATLHNIARWDGTNWKPVGLGLDDNDPWNYEAWVKSLEVYNGELYASGDFSYINGTQHVNHLAKWNGVTWSAVGEDDYVNADNMKSYNGKLYAIGDVYGGASVFNGISWQIFGFGNIGVRDGIVIYDDTLYISGSFDYTTTSGAIAHEIAALDLNSIPTSVDLHYNFSQLAIYPNPATDHITIPIEPNETATIEIRNALGRLVAQSTLHPNQRTIPVADLPAGFYLVTVESKGKRVAGRFVKM